MPPLSKTLRSMSPEGYAAQEQLPGAPPRTTGGAQGANPFIRCPLPPFNVSPDTLKQFPENGKVPTRRVIPLPIAVAAGGGNTTVNNNVVVAGSSGSSSSSGSAEVTVQAQTVTFSAPSLDSGGSVMGSVTLSAISAVLMILGSSDQCEVRIYGDPLTQAVDVSRTSDSPPAFEVTQGLVSDIIFDTTPYLWPWQNRVFVNQDSPAAATLYITVINNTSGTVVPSVTITYLPLE